MGLQHFDQFEQPGILKILIIFTQLDSNLASGHTDERADFILTGYAGPVRQRDQPQIRIHFPDPVRTGFYDINKPLLAFADPEQRRFQGVRHLIELPDDAF